MSSRLTELDIAIQWLKEAGAEGVWLIRGAANGMLVYTATNPDGGEPVPMPFLTLNPPHEIILIARFTQGDAKPDGIEFLG